MMTFTVDKASTAVSIATSANSIDEGASIEISGSISPGIAGVQVTIVFVRPDGSTVSRTASTSFNGGFSFRYTPDAVGRWTVSDSWAGSENYRPATSEPPTFTVSKPFPIALIVASVVIAFIIGGFIVQVETKVVCSKASVVASNVENASSVDSAR